MRNDPTDVLVERFLKKPGIEGEKLDFKAKNKISSNAGLRDLVKTMVAMANRWGGTIIIGVGDDKNRKSIEQFSATTEIKRDLSNVIKDNTEPDLSKNVDIEFDAVNNGQEVLRIDVDRTDRELYKFNTREKDGYVPYWRVNDETLEMGPEEAIEFAEAHRENHDFAASPQTETIRHLPISNSSITEISSPNNRTVVSNKEGFQPVFDVSLMSRNQPLIFDLSTQAGLKNAEDIEILLNTADKNLSFDKKSILYSIQQGTRTWFGRGGEQLLEDINQFENVVNQMLGAHPREVSEEITHLNDIRSTIALVGTCFLGLFHAELYWKYTSFSKARIGVRLEDIPFNDDFLHDFFDNYGNGPTTYEQQRNRTDHFILRGDFDLKNTTAVDFRKNSEFTSYVVADNPFYKQKSAVQNQANGNLPKFGLENFCSISRIPFRISDGTTDPENKRFQMQSVTVWPTDYLYSPMYIEAKCTSSVLH